MVDSNGQKILKKENILWPFVRTCSKLTCLVKIPGFLTKAMWLLFQLAEQSLRDFFQVPQANPRTCQGRKALEIVKPKLKRQEWYRMVLYKKSKDWDLWKMFVNRDVVSHKVQQKGCNIPCAPTWSRHADASGKLLESLADTMRDPQAQQQFAHTLPLQVQAAGAGKMLEGPMVGEWWKVETRKMLTSNVVFHIFQILRSRRFDPLVWSDRGEWFLSDSPPTGHPQRNSQSSQSPQTKKTWISKEKYYNNEYTNIRTRRQWTMKNQYKT